ncbi:unnamed protein product, partial [Durusdinium trenchii]
MRKRSSGEIDADDLAGEEEEKDMDLSSTDEDLQSRAPLHRGGDDASSSSAGSTGSSSGEHGEHTSKLTSSDSRLPTNEMGGVLNDAHSADLSREIGELMMGEMDVMNGAEFAALTMRSGDWTGDHQNSSMQHYSSANPTNGSRSKNKNNNKGLRCSTTCKMRLHRVLQGRGVFGLVETARPGNNTTPRRIVAENGEVLLEFSNRVELFESIEHHGYALSSEVKYHGRNSSPRDVFSSVPEDAKVLGLTTPKPPKEVQQVIGKLLRQNPDDELRQESGVLWCKHVAQKSSSRDLLVRSRNDPESCRFKINCYRLKLKSSGEELFYIPTRQFMFFDKDISEWSAHPRAGYFMHGCSCDFARKSGGSAGGSSSSSGSVNARASKPGAASSKRSSVGKRSTAAKTKTAAGAKRKARKRQSP